MAILYFVVPNDQHQLRNIAQECSQRSIGDSNIISIETLTTGQIKVWYGTDLDKQVDIFTAITTPSHAPRSCDPDFGIPYDPLKQAPSSDLMRSWLTPEAAQRAAIDHDVPMDLVVETAMRETTEGKVILDGYSDIKTDIARLAANATGVDPAFVSGIIETESLQDAETEEVSDADIERAIAEMDSKLPNSKKSFRKNR